MKLWQYLRDRYYLYRESNRVRLTKRKKKSEDDGGIRAFLLGLGTIGYGILSLFAKPRCPNCDSEVEKYTPQCPSCRMYLQWE